MKKTIKDAHEKIDIKFTQDMPKLIEKIFNTKIASIDSKIMKMNDEFEKNLNNYKEIMKTNILTIQKNVKLNSDEIKKNFPNPSLFPSSISPSYLPLSYCWT